MALKNTAAVEHKFRDVLYETRVRPPVTMGRLTVIKRPYEPITTSYGIRARVGATHPADCDHWEPQNAYRSRNLKRIQVHRGPSGEDTAVLRRTSPTRRLFGLIRPVGESLG